MTSIGSEGMTASPFVKWVGGKGQLLYRLLALMPKTIACYWEPFVGGGALFWALSNEGRFRRAVLSDTNRHLVRTYLAIQRNHVGLLRELALHKHSASHFKRVREMDPDKMTDEACAARFIFLNKAGYNGLYRENASGRFNVPFGRQPKMSIFVDPARIKACAIALNRRPVTIVEGDFEAVTRKVRLGDAVYSDSPYAPLSKTSSFTAFTAAKFTDADQERLAAWFRALDERGIAVLLSNSSCDQVERLYAGLNIERVYAKRAVNSKADKRGEIKEVLVRGRALTASVGKERRANR